MRIAGWNPNKFDETFENIAMDRLIEAAEVIATKARSNFPETQGISRPMYKTGKGGGKTWSSRDAGRLKKSIRVVRKKTKGGKAFSRKRNVRIITGHYTAYYPYWVEFGSGTIKRKHGEKIEIATSRRKKKLTVRDIEFGTDRIPPRPFMRPAFNSSIDEIKSIIGVK